MVREWIEFFIELYEVEEVEFQRCVKPSDAIGDPILVIFSDGSGDLYGAAVYVRWEIKDGTYQSRLLVAKNRVAPMKVIDIVRLELSGVLIGKRLRMFIQKEMRYNFSKVYHIMDSEIVKAMISKESYGFNTFAANRIGEIQQDTIEEEYYWLPGKLNVADYLTRGKSPKDIKEGTPWQDAPKFLANDKSEWPITNKYEVPTENLPERPKQVLVTEEVTVKTTFPEIMDVERFRSLDLLLNTTARIIRLQLSRKEGAGENDMQLQAVDIEKAERLWIIEAQKNLIKKIEEGKYKKLCPQVQDGIFVVGGRTERWQGATWNRQRFILLPKDHKLSKLIANKKHNENGHLAVAATGRTNSK